jgi:hypothetical protein
MVGRELTKEECEYNNASDDESVRHHLILLTDAAAGMGKNASNGLTGYVKYLAKSSPRETTLAVKEALKYHAKV